MCTVRTRRLLLLQLPCCLACSLSVSLFPHPPTLTPTLGLLIDRPAAATAVATATAGKARERTPRPLRASERECVVLLQNERSKEAAVTFALSLSRARQLFSGHSLIETSVVVVVVVVVACPLLHVRA